MILQYRLPFDVPGLGVKGDVIVVDAETGTIEVARELPAAALLTLAELIPQLEPLAMRISQARAIAIVESLLDGRRRRAPDIDIEAALQRLESGATLPEEPDIREFTADHRYPHMTLWKTGRFRPGIRFETWCRWIHAHNRITQRCNREIRQHVAVPCRVCGEPFYRDTIRRVRCDACVAKARELRGEA